MQNKIVACYAYIKHKFLHVEKVIEIKKGSKSLICVAGNKKPVLQCLECFEISRPHNSLKLISLFRERNDVFAET